MNFSIQSYLLKLFNEKGIDLKSPITAKLADGTHRNMRIDDVFNFICRAKRSDQVKILEKFMQIDYMNGDIMHFVQYIANYMTIPTPHK